MNGSVRVRFAPSPTGVPHVGNLRTALFNWLFARHSGGAFIVRIEDTDVVRKARGAVEAILESLRWLGLDWDEGPEAFDPISGRGLGGGYGPYFQSQRLELYQSTARRLVEQGHVYLCYCSPERLQEMRAQQAQRKEPPRYDRRCRDLAKVERHRLEGSGVTPVVRFKAPLGGQTSFKDLIRGDITVDNGTLDDFVLLKSDGYPTYHLANVIDDHLMEISHIMRADEWLASTPRHVLLYRALGYELPRFAHLPMILGSDRSKLSKRHGATSIMEFQKQGYLPEAVTNFLALLGWALDDRTEIMSREELIAHFTIERIGKTGAIFSHEKLNWMNGVYLRRLGLGELVERAFPFLEEGLREKVKHPISRDYFREIAPLVQERMKTFGEVAELCEFFFLDELTYDTTLLSKDMPRETAARALEASLDRGQALVDFDDASLEGVLRPLAAELGLKTGQLFGALRVATTGRAAAPPLFQTMAVLGRERCLKRIKSALERLQGGD